MTWGQGQIYNPENPGPRFFANHLQPRDVPKEAWPRHPGEFRGPRCLIKHSMFPHSRVSQFLGEFSGHTIFFQYHCAFVCFFLVVSLLSTMVKVNHHETTIWGTFSIFPTTLSLWRSRYSRMSPWWKNTFVYARVVCPVLLLPNVWCWCSPKSPTTSNHHLRNGILPFGWW